MKYKILGNRVLIEFLNAFDDDSCSSGIVRSVGAGCDAPDGSFFIGCEVLFLKYSGVVYMDGNIEYRIIPFDDIVGIKHEVFMDILQEKIVSKDKIIAEYKLGLEVYLDKISALKTTIKELKEENEYLIRGCIRFIEGRPDVR